MNNKARNVLAMTLSALVCVCAGAQNVMFKSNEDFGIAYTIYGDDSQYPQAELDQEMIQVRYHCQMAFEDGIRPPLETDYILQIGRRTSKYSQRIQYQADSLLGYGPRLTARYQLYEKANPLFAQECYYIDLLTRRATVTGRLITEDFAYEEQLPEIRWQLIDSLKVICGHTCHRASGSFRGREYQVWYADDIPTTAGPWKLQGLPGAILQAEDLEGDCRFEATEVRMVSGKITKSEYPYIKVSRAQYARMQSQFLENHGLFASQHTSRVSGLTIQIVKKSTPLPVPVWLEKE